MTTQTSPEAALAPLPFGATVRPGGVLFSLFAPACDRVALHLDGRGAPLAMAAGEDGWHRLEVAEARAGSRYRFGLPDGLQVPDPASRFQPEDVHGPSEVVDPAAFGWTDGAWRGRPWRETVVYEAHVGTLTPEGTFRAAIGKLDHLVSLGVTALQLMPVAEFAGRRGWGYDGVLWYAPDAAYGHPDDLRALVDAAHARGLQVFLDVVYNHFGPDGNYLGAYAPQFFTDRHHTPWGKAINYDGRHSRVVRDFAIGNALYWIREFHVDGLRLDAVHAIVDDSDPTLITELAARVRALDPGRPFHLIVENEDNGAHHLVRRDDGAGWFSGQWNDDVHHVLHVAATGEDAGYYADYAGDTAALGRALAEGFAFQGEVMPYRGSARGEPSADLPTEAFVAFVQNHDQIGNRAYGDRLTGSLAPEVLRALGAVALLLPQTPMLFMGEEWGSAAPFLFFCDFEGELADLVRKGRREEFKRFPEFQDEAKRDTIPDPLADDTFNRCKLDWSDLDRPEPRARLDWYRRVLAARRDALLPLLDEVGARGGRHREVGPAAVEVRWGRLRLDANLKPAEQDGFEPAAGHVVWQEGAADGTRLGPWAVRWTLAKQGA